MAKEIIILAPFNGMIKDLKTVDDPVFAEGMVGQGVAITPSSDVTEVLNVVKKGKIKMAFDGGHAYGIEYKDIEILLHIGIETVGLKGEGFDKKVSAGDKVKDTSVLTGIDLEIISKKAKSTDTMVLITNESIGDWKIEKITSTEVKAGEPLFKLVK